MTNLVSKDGKQFYEIGEDFDPQSGVDKSLDAAQAKGYQRYVDVTKDGNETFTIPATHDSLKAATDKGYRESSQVKNDVTNKKKIEDSEPKMSPGMAAAVGASQGMSMGWGDEIASGMKGGYDMLVHGKNPITSAKEEYAAQQEALRKSAADQPVARYGTELVSGFASGLGAGKLASTAMTAAPEAANVMSRLVQGAKTGATYGAVTGAGTGDDLSSRVKGAAEGAAGGAVIGGAVDVAAPYVKAVPAGVKSAFQNFKAKDTVVGNAKEVFNSAKIGIRTIANEDSSGRAIQSLAKKARENLASDPKFVTNGKPLESMSDEDAILMDVMRPGESDVKDFVTAKSSSVVGQKGTPEDIGKVLEMSSSDVGEAAAFRKREAAKGLAPEAKSSQKSFQAQQGPIYGAHKEAAMQEFEPEKIKDVWSSLDPLRQEVKNNPNMSAGGKNALEYAEQAIQTGRAGRQFDLTEGRGMGMVDKAEAFKRTHAARQIIDSAALQAKDNGEKWALRDVRTKLDDILKSTKSMSEADTIYKQGKDFAANLFEPFMTTGKNKKSQIDTAKLAKAFGDNDSAQRLGESIPSLRTYLKKNKDIISNYGQVNGFINNLEKQMKVADNQRLITRAGANPSGTGGVVTRNDRTKTGFIENLYRNPVETKLSVSNFMNKHAPLVGKTADKLDAESQRKILKMYLWSQKNPEATVEQTQSIFNKFAKGEL
jgi:hypothetical protein